MFFNRKSLLLFGFAQVLFLTACGIKFGEENVDNKKAEVQSAQCLKNSIEELNLFFAGDATNDQVTNSIQCLQNVFLAFKDNIRGQNKDSFTPAEIAHFVETNFLKDETHFSENFLSEIMKLKVALFGGDAAIIKKDEIDLVVNFMARIKPDVVRINSHMKIITMKWIASLQPTDSVEKEEKFQKAKVDLFRLINRFSVEFAFQGRKYAIDDLMNFLIETAKFAEADPKTIDKIDKAKPFIKKFKYYLIGGDSSLQGQDWIRLGMTMHEAYFQALRVEYFLTGLTDDQVKEKWKTYEHIASDLSALVEKLLLAKQTEVLTNEEIYDLLQPLTSLVSNFPVDQELLKHLGELKVVFLGASEAGANGWARKDFSVLNKKIPILFKNFSEINELTDYLALETDETFRSHLKYEEFLSAETRLILAVAEISEQLEQSYDLNSLKNFLLNLANGALQDSFKLPENFESLYRMIVAAKPVLTGNSATQMSVTEMRQIFNVGIRAFLNYKEYNLFVANYEFEEVNFISNLHRVWKKAIGTLSYELESKPSHLISTDELTQLVMTLQQESFLKTKIKKESMVLLLNGVWSNILNDPALRIKKEIQPGFNQVVVSQLANESEIWFLGQTALNKVFETKLVWTKKELVDELSAQLALAEDKNLAEALKEILASVNQDISHNFNANGFLNILSDSVGQYHFDDLKNSNLARAMARLGIRSYANEIVRVESLSGITLEEAQTGFNQLGAMAIDLEFLDPASVGFVASRYREANLFLSTSNGDNYAQFDELQKLILHILSGVARAEQVKQTIITKCLPPIVFDVTPNTTVDEQCLLGVYLTEVDAFLGIPQFINMRTTFKEEDLKLYYLSLLKAAGYIPDDKHLVYFYDADLFPHVVQYIEMIYARHDTSRDHLLQKDEALKAFPIFKELLRELVKSYKQIKEEDLPGVFIYILKHGRPPKSTSLAELLKFMAFIRDKDQKGWDIQSTRIDLGKIFNYIADATKPAPTDEPEPPMPTPEPPAVSSADVTPVTN